MYAETACPRKLEYNHNPICCIREKKRKERKEKVVWLKTKITCNRTDSKRLRADPPDDTIAVPFLPKQLAILCRYGGEQRWRPWRGRRERIQ
jgi:hypothetical protein